MAESKEQYFPYLKELGFTYTESYEKQSDASCVYIHRFRRGQDYIDFRAVAGGHISIMVKKDGHYAFPDLKTLYKKEYFAFNARHFFKKATPEEEWVFVASLMQKEYEARPDLFGLLPPRR